MPSPKSIQDLFLEEARDLYDAEEQLTAAFPKLVEAATSEELRAALEMHLEETRTHIHRLEEMFELLDEKPSRRHCAGIAGILQETNHLLKERVERVRDEGIVATARRAAHYEISAYGSLIASATTLGSDEIADILRRTLEEEKVADDTLQSLSEGSFNEARGYRLDIREAKAAGARA
jgi:ferritin-like metal-binding protein YciE